MSAGRSALLDGDGDGSGMVAELPLIDTILSFPRGTMADRVMGHRQANPIGAHPMILTVFGIVASITLLIGSVYALIRNDRDLDAYAVADATRTAAALTMAAATDGTV